MLIMHSFGLCRIVCRSLRLQVYIDSFPSVFSAKDLPFPG